MPTEQEYLFEERAAIAEFDGHLSREEAEALARSEAARPGIRATKPPADDSGRTGTSDK